MMAAVANGAGRDVVRVRVWLTAARPRTLSAAVSPVVVGSSLGYQLNDTFRFGAFVAMLAFWILAQVGTNLSNDYHDARRGADAKDRIGPVRVTAAGLVAPARVLRASWIAFALAGLCDLYLVAVAGIELLLIGVASLAAGMLYTGGPRPYGYEGLGEPAVFLFFGMVAVTGSTFVQTMTWPGEAFVLAVPVGMLATAILAVNNIRDVQSDTRAGKRTLAVRLGQDRAKMLYAAMVLGAYLVASLAWLLGWLSPWVALYVLTLPRAVTLVRTVRRHADGPTLNAALAGTAMHQLVFCLLLSASIVTN